MEAANCTDAEDPANVERSKRENVGAMVQFRRQQAMAPGMSREEINLTPVNRSGNKRVGRSTKRRIHEDFCWIFEIFNLVKTAASDNANCGSYFTHPGED
jgi:hypothetical protein